MTYTDAEYQTYLKVQHALRLEDARNYVADVLADMRGVWSDEISSEELEQFDFEDMVKQFEEKTYYSDPSADAWREIAGEAVDDYLYEIGEA